MNTDFSVIIKIRSSIHKMSLVSQKIVTPNQGVVALSRYHLTMLALGPHCHMPGFEA